MQTVLAGAISALLRVHVPSSLVMVWFTNPLTMPPLLYIAWLVGTTIITPTPDLQNLSFTLPSVMYAMKYGWPILCVGCLALAVVSSALGYVGVRWAMRDAQQEPPVEIDGQAS